VASLIQIKPGSVIETPKRRFQGFPSSQRRPSDGRRVFPKNCSGFRHVGHEPVLVPLIAPLGR
jgi:hypothetical protein